MARIEKQKDPSCKQLCQSRNKILQESLSRKHSTNSVLEGEDCVIGFAPFRLMLAIASGLKDL